MRWLNAVRLLAILLVAAPAHVGLAKAAATPNDPAAYCRARGTDDDLHRLPPALVPAVKTLFFSSTAPDRMVLDTTVFRCLGGQVLVCATGANLPCGKADTARTSVGASAWCDSHPDASFVPMFATGHNTLWRWSCEGRHAIASDGAKLDRRGFFWQNWKLLR
jgi:hypothetical protein